MKSKHSKLPDVDERQAALTKIRNLKMARSVHAYVRGNTSKFYEWLETVNSTYLPSGPAIWICGDCHIGNLGPIADSKGSVDIHIRDFDQAVIGNPAHDLIRLALSLAAAARSSDLPGITTVKMLEQIMEGYQQAFSDNSDAAKAEHEPDVVKITLKQALRRTWKHLAKDRIHDTNPDIPLGKRFWPLSKKENHELQALFKREEVSDLITLLRSRDNDADWKLADAAYWVKGCSSLGRLRIAALLQMTGKSAKNELCLIDIKEAVTAVAPNYSRTKMPSDNAQRVVTAAQHLAPSLGKRMLAARFLGHAVFLRELLPQDLKPDISTLTCEEAINTARFFATVVGKAHACQMDKSTRKHWLAELQRRRSKTLDAPSWLWTSVIELITSHEAAYLEHCRRHAFNPPTSK